MKEYQVDLDPNKLLAYGVSVSEVVDKIRASNGDVGGKVLKWPPCEYYVRGRGYIKNIADIPDVPLKDAKRHAGLRQEYWHGSSWPGLATRCLPS